MTLADALNREFCWRYQRSKDHASIAVLREIEVQQFESNGLSPFVQAMPNQYKRPNDPIAAYRAFYCGEKAQFASWRKRLAPSWFEAGVGNIISASDVGSSSPDDGCAKTEDVE